MAWPPPVLPVNRTNADPQQDTHPADHNAQALAINDTVLHGRTLTPLFGAAFSPIDQAPVPPLTVLRMAAGKVNITAGVDGGAVLPIPGNFATLVSVVVSPTVTPGGGAGQGSQAFAYEVAYRSTPSSCVVYARRAGLIYQGLIGVNYIALGY